MSFSPTSSASIVQSDTSEAASLSLNHILIPILDEIQPQSEENSFIVDNLKTQFVMAEKEAPGFTEEFLYGIFSKQTGGNEDSFTKGLLKMSNGEGDDSPSPDMTDEALDERAASEKDHETSVMPQQKASEDEISLTQHGRFLKETLSRIPADIAARETFVQTIREVAVGIKSLLRANEAAVESCKDPRKKETLSKLRRDFLSCSQTFSNILKNYFQDEREAPVLASARRVIHHIDCMVIALKPVSDEEAE